MGMKTRSSKAVSEAVAALIAFTIAMMFFLGVYYSILSLLPRAADIPRIDVAEIETYSNIEVLRIGSGIYIVKNAGSTPVALDMGVVSTGESVVFVDISKICSGAIVIQPASQTIVTCTTEIIAFIARIGTSLNNVAIIYPHQPNVQPVARYITMKPLLTWNVSLNIVKYMENQNTLSSRAIDTSLAMQLYLNSSGTINANLQSVALAVITSAGTNRYNILIVGSRALGGTINSISVAGSNYDLSRAGFYRYRIKIINFTGSIQLGNTNAGRGIYPCYIDQDATCTVTLSGSADRILIYTNSSSATWGVVGLDPYYIVGDLDGNGYPEYIFTTQDFTVGSSSTVNDGISSYNINVVDYSVTPLRIVFRDLPIYSNRYANAIVSLRLFYWDNSQDDTIDNDNRVILRVGLYDPSSNSFVYSTSLSYYELCRYRSVKPFSASYIVKDFLLYVPPSPSGKTYYVAIEVVDPYSISGNRNDADIILGIEYIGVVLGVKS